MYFEILLKDLRFYAYHGVFENERSTGNEFIVNLSVSIPFKTEIEEDDLEATVSYADLYEIVEKEMKKPRKLLETVTAGVYNQIHLKYPQVTGGFISIEKVRPPIPDMIGSAKVTLNF